MKQTAKRGVSPFSFICDTNIYVSLKSVFYFFESIVKLLVWN